MELIQTLATQLGISEAQARSGAGILLGFAKEKLDAGTFSQITQAVPGLAELIPAETAAADGGLGGLLGGLGAAFGGESIGNLASLAGKFADQGLDGSTVGSFLPALLDFLRGKLSPDLADQVQGALAA